MKKIFNFAWKAAAFVLTCAAITAYILLICNPN